MKTSLFNFELPPNLVAQFPTASRGDSRLLVYNRATSKLSHSFVKNLSDFLPDHTLIVMNNSKVRQARVYATSANGGVVELVFLRPIANEKNEVDSTKWEVLCSKSAKQKIGKVLTLPSGINSTIEADLGEGVKILKVEQPLSEKWFEENGHIPLPPYIKRDDNSFDASRYQTVFCKSVGSAAAPTAGLHFTSEMIKSLKDEKRDIDICEVTLHVGLGTFLPVRTSEISEHKMHTEYYFVADEVASKINSAILNGKTILALGTTTVRTLESASIYSSEQKKYLVKNGYGATNIFIYPGYEFKIVKSLFTNFHTPESTLLMLVSAFVGREKILEIYKTAVENEYRFFSYGDATLFL